MKLEGERARTTLKVLETMTYSCTSPQDLHELANKVERLITDFRAKLPKSEGIILRPEARKSVRKRAQQILKKYRPLPSRVRRGRQKSDWRHRNRFGQKASELRKVHVHVLAFVHACDFICAHVIGYTKTSENSTKGPNQARSCTPTRKYTQASTTHLHSN